MPRVSPWSEGVVMAEVARAADHLGPARAPRPHGARPAVLAVLRGGPRPLLAAAPPRGLRREGGRLGLEVEPVPGHQRAVRARHLRLVQAVGDHLGHHHHGQDYGDVTILTVSLSPWKSMMLTGQAGTSTNPSRGEAATGAIEAK